MAICMKCGADSPGRFCATCGHPLVAPAPQSTPDLPENVVCLLCYVLWALTGVIFLVLEPYNKSKVVRFHAWQSIMLNLVWFTGWFAVLGMATVLRLIPWIGSPIASFLVGLFGLLLFVLWVTLMVKAYQGTALELPWISNIARKQS